MSSWPQAEGANFRKPAQQSPLLHRLLSLVLQVGKIKISAYTTPIHLLACESGGWYWQIINKFCFVLLTNLIWF